MKVIILSAAILSLIGCGQVMTGPQGDPGNGCSVTTVQPEGSAPNGGALIQCGTTSSTLLLNGSNGTPGTVLTPIQFCPNVVPTFPTVFPEVGFLISGSIYAVYSANDGFLTVIPPGTYTSNAVGSACNFTVNANGTVSN